MQQKNNLLYEDLTESRLEGLKIMFNKLLTIIIALVNWWNLLGNDIENMNKELANWIKDNKLYNERNELLELEDSIGD